jgi:hypothetical protein
VYSCGGHAYLVLVLVKWARKYVLSITYVYVGTNKGVCLAQYEPTTLQENEKAHATKVTERDPSQNSGRTRSSLSDRIQRDGARLLR